MSEPRPTEPAKDPGSAALPQGSPRPTAAQVEATLRAAFDPVELTVTDDSHAHAGHAGAREGSHFTVHLRSERFRGLSRVSRHRLVYDALSLWMHRGIHALALQARTPDEP